MKNFFSMSHGDLGFIAALLALAFVAFLPVVREAEWAGMSMLGWTMAGLMVLSPVIALVRLMSESKEGNT